MSISWKPATRFRTASASPVLSGSNKPRMSVPRALLTSKTLRHSSALRTAVDFYHCRRHSAGSRRSHRVSPVMHAGPHTGGGELVQLEDESKIDAFLDTLKYDDRGLVVAIVQEVDSGAILMQAFADRPAIKKTLLEGKASFYSRSRGGPWTKGESSGNVIHVKSVHIDCDRDSLIYVGDPVGPTCHTGAETCYYTHLHDTPSLPNLESAVEGAAEVALTTLPALEATILERKAELSDPNAKKSWTAKLLKDPELLCSKIREEAGELCQSYELKEGKKATASEMADVLYHSMVLLAHEDVPIKDVMVELRRRFGTSGIDEKAARKPKS